MSLDKKSTVKIAKESRDSKASIKLSAAEKVVEKSNNNASGFEFSYAPALESSAIIKIKPRYDLFIDGKFISPKSNSFMPSINPANGELLTELAIADSKDVDLAVKAARSAYENIWSKTSGAVRGRYLFRIARILQERAREFAVLESIDNGKPIRESRDIDIPLAAAHFFYYAGWADKIAYAFPGQKFSALGVAAQVIPWNFPLLMAAWKIAPALATGNTVVLKPAETTSLTALLLAEVIQEAGIPEGVVNIITGGAETGAALVAHADVDKIAFTGSTVVGKFILKSAANSNKRISLELGGKSAQIVYEDAALDQAVEGVINGIYFNQGHVCCAGSRLLLQESIRDVFMRKLKKRMQSLRVGDPLDKNTDVGAINSLSELLKIQEFVAQGKQEQGEYFEASAETLPKKGYYHRPCFIADVAPSSALYRQEIFGPVLTISTFRTPAEAIEKANDTVYGLAAGIWTEKSAKIAETARKLKAGVIWANTYNRFDPASPFGGYRESGFGREGGKQGLLPYLEVRS
ncbi:MAG: aldehyde dehydrogenase family protein [Oligoflexales bacterium]|nr:aldehyde dehydrogenase family protein [Oligoflexales bacterium]